MASCEKCWSDAYRRAYGGNGDQAEHYRKLMQERKSNPCTPKEQAGQFWDEEKQIDIRFVTPSL